MAEADALARAFDQARHVGDDELPAVRRLGRAEHRLQRRERVVGDLRRRVRDAREQRRLARVRQADERRVREQLQVQLEVALLAGRADLGELRYLPRRRDEARVAAAAAAAAREHDARAGMREVGDQVAFVREHLRADRHVQLDVLAVGAVLARAACRSRRASALIQRRRCSDDRSRSDGSASSTTSPPLPPSPPSGPPFGTNFSRRKLMPPSPPLPAWTWMVARSLNTPNGSALRRAARLRGRLLLCRLVDDRHETALAARAEEDRAGRGSRRSCGRGRSACRGPGGTSCRAGGR